MPNFRNAAQAGFTLVEVLIAMLIGVVGMIVIMQVYAVSENFKRTSTSGTDAQVNGSIALYLLEREIRLAGYGLNSLVPSGCTSVVVHSVSAGKSLSLRMVPFEINPAGIPAGDPNTDVLLITYGSSGDFAGGVPVDQLAVNTANLRVNFNRDGFRAGDLVVAMQPGGGPGGTTSCVLHELTGVPGAGGNCGTPSVGGSNMLNHGTAQYKSFHAACQPVTPRYNTAAGIKDPSGAATPVLNSQTGAKLFDLGAAPIMKVYAIRGGNLTTCDMLVADCTLAAGYVVAVNDIVSLRAAYGADFDGNASPGTPVGDGQVDRWTRAALVTPEQVSRTLAAAVAITSRSALKEKPANGGTVCDATLSATRPDRGMTTDWYESLKAQAAPGGTLTPGGINLAATDPDWACYRYRLYQTTIPLRNMIWRP
jgi:type IV pilus assembly protein PilW